MPSQSRYTDANTLTGQRSGEIRRLLSEMFPSQNQLKVFLEETLGKETAIDIKWGSSLSIVAFNLVERQQSYGQIGLLLERMSEQPGSQKAAELVSYLVEAGYLRDSQAVKPAPTFRQVDWLQERDRFTADDSLISAVVDALCLTFLSNAELECFLIGSFTNDFARQCAHNINRGSSARSNVQQTVSDFAGVGWLTALTAAAQDADMNGVTTLFLLLNSMRQSNAEHVQQTPPRASAAAAPAAPAPQQRLMVTALRMPLGESEQAELAELLRRAFNPHGLDEIACLHLGQRLRDITPSGTMPAMARGLVEWCVEHGRPVVDLLNAITKQRPSRTDVPAFIQKLADGGYIEVTRC